MARLDSELVRLNLLQSRERAKEAILRGSVTVNGKTVLKPSAEVSEADEISFIGEKLRYVGRGGLKLEGALKSFELSLDGAVCLDIGASTGGFTDCMLSSGAKRVYAVDVGHGQLAQKLLDDPRVMNFEGVNVKDIVPEMFPEAPGFVSADLSFISVKYAAEAANKVLGYGGRAVLLIKPQFEVGRKFVSKGGVVKDKSAHITALDSLCKYFSSLGFFIKDLTYSPIKGGDGNIEYLVYLVKQESFTPKNFDFRSLCDRAFSSLKGHD